ncbi:hypothetical protein H0H87_007867 [Tephrocybe sp. NHM501043]|nr:hypothetical protein H0H87_007867 [Tephrocybe sp. NHM501043]
MQSLSPVFTDSSNTITQANTDTPSASSTPPEVSTTDTQNTQPTKMPELNIIPFHSNLEDESPRDFMNKIKTYFVLGTMRDKSNAYKIDIFEWSLKDSGAAAEWFRALLAKKKD